MKRFFILLIVSQTWTTFGQSYESIFSNDTTKWHVYKMIPDYSITKAYYSYSDSIIEDKKYYKLFSEYVDSETIIGENGTLCGLIYEDTITGKYWFRKHTTDGDKEALFMDLSLEQGDTTEIISDFRYMWKDSVVVDTVFYLNNRKVIELDKLIYDGWGNSYNVQYIEGIGSSYGFYMAELYEEPNEQVLLCKFNNNELIHSTVSNINGNCYLQSVGVDSEIGKAKIKLYPNPSYGNVKVEIDDTFKHCELEILNLQGQIIMRDIFNSKTTNIELKNKGIFFIRVYLDNAVVVKKIINNGY